MLRTALVVLALLMAAPVLAQGPNNYIPFTRTHQDSTRLHVAWIEDDFGMLNSTEANRNGSLLDRYIQLANLRDMLIKGGIEVHTYTYSWFAAQQAGGVVTKWADLGDTRSSGGGGYAVALMVGWYGEKGGGALARNFAGPNGYCRYWRACSTSAQIIHVALNGSMTYNDNPGAALPDSILGNCISGSGGEQILSLGSNPGAPQRTPRVASSGDSMFVSRGFGLVTLASTYRPPGASLVRLFNVGAQLSSDTVSTAANDTVWLAYRVRYTTQGHANSATPYTDFVVTSEPTTGLTPTNKTTAAITWALLSRHVRLPSIPVVMCFNDYGAFGSNPTSNYAYPRATYIDSVFRDLRQNFNVKTIVVGTNPDSAAYYWNTYGYSSNKNHPNILWAQHWHSQDSLTAFASAHGRSQGNYSGSAAINLRRVAFRYDPSNASAYLRYGIYQTITKSDSLLRANGASPVNYYQPGNDITVPSYFGSWTSTPSATAVAGVDSMFQAFSAGGKTLICGSVSGSSARGARATGGTSFVWSVLPEETYVCSNGSKIRFGQYVGVSSSAAAPLPVATALGLVSHRTNTIMGFLATANATAPVAYGYGQTVDNPGFQYMTGRVRGWESHINFFTNANPGFEVESQALKWCALWPIRSLNSLAGHTLLEWTTPEEAWSRY